MASKDKPAQSDVRIVGGKTTVKLRSYGENTMARMNDLLAELRQNATTHANVSQAVAETSVALIKLNLALGFQGLPASADSKPAA